MPFLVERFYVRLCNTSVFFGVEREEGVFCFFSFGAVNGGNYCSCSSLPNMPVLTEDHLRQYVHSMLANLLSQPGNVGTNLPSTAPPAVPDSAPMSTGAAGGLGSVTPFEVPITESPGAVLPTTQEDLPPS